MPYVDRDTDGRIKALILSASASAEFLPAEHPEVLQFLVSPAGQGSGHLEPHGLDLLLSDLKLIRVIEDVIDLLIAKGVIIFSDLPAPVQQKILQKRGKREKMFGGGDLLGGEERLL